MIRKELLYLVNGYTDSKDVRIRLHFRDLPECSIRFRFTRRLIFIHIQTRSNYVINVLI